MDFLKNTTFLISARTPRTIVDKLDKTNLFFFENGTSYKKDFGNISAPCVGSTTYLLLILFGIKELYLLGLDLALDSKTGATHSDGHKYSKELDLNNLAVNSDTLSYKKSILKTPGNLKEEVYTTSSFLTSINSINTTSQNYKTDNQNVYNLSNGAKFINTFSLSMNKIKISTLSDLDKDLLLNEIHNIFMKNSSHHITTDELKSLKEKKAFSEKVKVIILAQEQSKYTSCDDFLNSIIVLFEKIGVSSSSIEQDLALVYQEYARFIFTFIFDFFNASKLINEVEHANNINILLCKQLLRIVITYEREL